MDTVRVNICYRPLRIAWAIGAGDIEAFRTAARLSFALWGGRFNPIIVVDRPEEAESLVNLFRVDVILPIGPSEAVQAFPKRFPHLIKPFFHDGVFIDDGEGGARSQVLDIHNALVHLDQSSEWQGVKEKGLRLYTWASDDPLADVFLTQFGDYPRVEEVKINYRELLRDATKATEMAIDPAAEFAADMFDHPSISFVSRCSLQRHYGMRAGWDSPGHNSKEGDSMKPSLSIGIEEEYQTIDPETRDLRSHIGMEMIAKGRAVLTERVKPEMHESVIEAGTRVCRNIQEATHEIHMIRRNLIDLAKQNGLRLAASASHPFADWSKQGIYPDERYHTIVEDMQMVARANLIFGLHVHIGVEDPETAIHIMNAARYFLPHILALSTNSPFWQGMHTGLKSYRCKVFDKFPRTNIPDYFPSYGEYESFINLLIKTNCIDNAKKIWWDIRPHPYFSTLEFRVCDIPMRAQETIALAALIQATVAKLYKLHSMNQGFRLYRRALIMENKWRALRYGIDGKLIDFGKGVEVPFHDLMDEYFEIIDDVVDELGSREEINYIREILKNGTGADRQLRFWNETHDMKKLVDYIIEETEAGIYDTEKRRAAAK